jgi:hypothetical protein
MFRPNKKHLQSSLFGDISNLTAKARADLERSWASVFYHEFFCRLDETPFAVLYSDEASRPNVAVNVLVGLEVLKAGFNWSDAELYDHFRYDVQVRYALGLHTLGDGEFELRTLYNFRRYLSDHRQETGKNLLEEAFAQITDEQIKAFQIKTKTLRMDSTQVASNIRRMTRLQLLVEVLQRVHRMLGEADQARYSEAFAPYLQGSSGQYMYHMRGKETSPHMQRIGELMQRLLAELAVSYATDATYQVLQRVFGEQFDVVDAKPQAKRGQDISASSLRSPDDPDATFRRKGQQTFEGLVANVTETCDPSNPVQLVAKVQAAPNTTEDTTLLVEALPELKERTGVDTLYSDAGFCGPEADEALREQQITQVPTDLRGKTPNPDKLHLDDFATSSTSGKPCEITCPSGQTVRLAAGRGTTCFIGRFSATACQSCPLQASCPTLLTKRAETRNLHFSQRELDVANRRRSSKAYRKEGTNLRSAIEATVGAIKRPFTDDQLPVRGVFRVLDVLIGSAAMLNVRRLQRYLAAKAAPDGPNPCPSGGEGAPQSQNSSFLLRLGARLRHWIWPCPALQAGFALIC